MRSVGLPTFDLILLGQIGRGVSIDGVPFTLQDVLFSYAGQIGLTNLLGSDPLVYGSIAFWAIFIAFAVKLAVWPFHTWLPDTYSEAPIGVSILLSAVMSKMGAYGMLRIMLPLVPEAAQQYAPPVGALALIGILTGAFGALAYTRGDSKRLIAYTSINHMGYVMLGIAGAAGVGAWGVDSIALLNSRAMAINGVLMQMVAHGLSTGALFLLVGMLYQRLGTYDLSAAGGLRTVMPTFAGVLGVALFANLGLPGLAGFVGEFFIFRGAWATLPLFTLFATVGLVITALALLLMFARLFLGPLNPRWSPDTGSAPPDIRTGEFWLAAPLLALLIVLGVYPALVMQLTNATVTEAVNVFVQLAS
jgi:NADH-quinone oxidoreductase subunit M